jgi:hypothetical protein
VRYGNDSKVIVIGSDHGIVYVYDRRSGELVGKLSSKGQDWVQTIVVRCTFHFESYAYDHIRLRTATVSPQFLSQNLGRTGGGTT